jgi:hypothetical protein
MDQEKREGQGMRFSRPTILQKRHDVFIRHALSLEPGRICMIMSYSQIAPAHPKPDARFAF